MIDKRVPDGTVVVYTTGAMGETIWGVTRGEQGGGCYLIESYRRSSSGTVTTYTRTLHRDRFRVVNGADDRC